MPLNKSKGNMFKAVGWTWNPAYGCSHSCPYKCWARWIVRKRWKKPWEPTFRDHYLKDKMPDDGTWIFVCSMGDLFCDGFSNEEIFKVLDVIEDYEGSCKFLLQTKNPLRFLYWEIANRLHDMRDKVILGTTIETNRFITGRGPTPKERYESMMWLKGQGFKRFLSMEPLADFDNETITDWLLDMYPIEVIEVGLENRGNIMRKPSVDKLKGLLGFLRANGFNYLLKNNLRFLEETVNE